MRRWTLSLLFCAVFSAPWPAAADPRSLIEGSYELIEWTDGEITLKPPAISGRYVIRDGGVTWVVHKSQDGKMLTNANFGNYRLTATTFNYGYGNFFSMSTDGQSYKVTRDAAAPYADMVLPRMREFSLKEENCIVKASYKSARFEFSRDGVTYIDDVSKAVRKYRRIVGD